MFNTSTKIYNESFTNLKINAVGGTLIKSHPKSFFIFSNYSNSRLFNVAGKSEILIKHGINRPYDDEYEEVVIIQSMLTGDNIVMCEIVKLEDYLNVD